MTLETKIGLVVGFAFILVIGILLSDHIGASNEPPAASLARVGDVVRQGVGMPSAPNPVQIPAAPIATIPPVVAPVQPVPTQADLRPVQVVAPLVQNESSRVAPPVTMEPPRNSSPTVPSGQAPAVVVAPRPDSLLQQIADQHHEELVAVDPRNTRKPGELLSSGIGPGSATGPLLTNPIQPIPPAAGSTSRTYVAAEGDSLSKMASKFFGNRSKASIDAIIRANPALKENPNRIVVGKAYVIPTEATKVTGESTAPAGPAAPVATIAPAVTPPVTVAANPVPAAPMWIPPSHSSEFATFAPAAPVAPAGNSSTATTPSANTSSDHMYTVKSSDNLWKIARDQLGDGNAWIAIRDLNKDILKGSDTVRVNMKLRLPVKG